MYCNLTPVQRGSSRRLSLLTWRQASGRLLPIHKTSEQPSQLGDLFYASFFFFYDFLIFILTAVGSLGSPKSVFSPVGGLFGGYDSSTTPYRPCFCLKELSLGNTNTVQWIVTGRGLDAQKSGAANFVLNELQMRCWHPATAGS